MSTSRRSQYGRLIHVNYVECEGKWSFDQLCIHYYKEHGKTYYKQIYNESMEHMSKCLELIDNMKYSISMIFTIHEMRYKMNLKYSQTQIIFQKFKSDANINGKRYMK